LDWYDFVRGTGQSLTRAGTYDTVIACDCAYFYPDIAALSSTLKGLLKQRETSRCFIFGPSNRGGLQRLISQMRGDESIEVAIENVGMARYRLDSSFDTAAEQNQPPLDFLQAAAQQAQGETESRFYSRYDSSFLLVTCSLRLEEQPENTSLSDID